MYCTYHPIYSSYSKLMSELKEPKDKRTFSIPSSAVYRKWAQEQRLYGILMRLENENEEETEKEQDSGQEKLCKEQKKGTWGGWNKRCFVPSRLGANTAQKQREQQQTHFQPMILGEGKLDMKVISAKLYLFVSERGLNKGSKPWSPDSK